VEGDVSEADEPLSLGWMSHWSWLERSLGRDIRAIAEGERELQNDDRRKQQAREQLISLFMVNDYLGIGVAMKCDNPTVKRIA
jgi:hypothetical protein